MRKASLVFTIAIAAITGNAEGALLPLDAGSPPVAAVVDGYKVYKYGEFDVYGVSPTYDEDLTIQNGNKTGWRKVEPKKSWEIKSNFLGLTPTRAPSSRSAEWEPYATVFLVDGNPSTVGFAGCPVGDPSITRAWVRVDFPRPVKVGGVRIVSRPDGIGMPVSFEIRAFKWDIWQTFKGGEQQTWQTVWKSDATGAQVLDKIGNTAPAVYKPLVTDGSDKCQARTCSFDPVEVREMWLTSPNDFYLGSLEVYDERGNNVALISKGCGVTVSAEQHLLWLSEQTQSALWQMNYDLGIKWMRENYYLTPLVEPLVDKGGKYEVDPYFDQLITEAGERGIEVCLTIPASANHEYYRFVVKHFRDRVKYFEIFNEFYNQDAHGKSKQGPVEQESSRYVELALPAAKIIRKEAPDAKIILCGPCPLVADWILACLKKGMAPYADVLAWHPYSFPQDSDDDYAPEELDRPRSVWAPEYVKTYADSIDYLKTEAAKLGFRGTLMANESGAYAIHAQRTSQLIAAKYLARSAVLHTSLEIPMLWNETTSLLRPSWQPFWSPGQPALKPAYSYYMMRTLCTLLDGAKPEKIVAEPKVSVDKLETHSFGLPGEKKLVAIWIREKSRKNRFDDYSGITTDVSISAKRPSRVIGIDLLNGREQELSFSVSGGRIVVPDLIIRDYPLLLRLE